MRRLDLDPKRLALVASLGGRARLTGHALLAERLKTNGITHVYGISGTPIDETLAACGAAGIRVIATRQQTPAVLAAAAHNYLAGELVAAVIVSAGPGVTHCATGIETAAANHWPVLVIGGRRPASMARMGAFQMLDGARLFEPITHASVRVDATPDLGGAIDDACRTAMRGLAGPVYLDVCEEALQGTAAPALPAARGGDDAADALDWAPAVKALLAARRPVLVIGSDARWGSPWALFERLVATWGLPFVTSPMARGFLPDSHPLNATRVRSGTLAETDLVLIVGASLDWVFRHGAEIAPGARLIRLARQSDPVFATRRDTIEHRGEPAALLAELFAAVAAAEGRVSVEAEWIQALAQRRADYGARVAPATADRAAPPTPAAWLAEVARALTPDTVTVLDGNVVMQWAQHVLPAERPLTRLTAGANGCMGTGIPFGIAACLAFPGRAAVVVCGDFALGHALMELETAVRHRIPLVVIVANNGGSGGSVRQAAFWPADYPERICRFAPGIRHDQMLIALGGQGKRVESADEIGPALRHALASGEPTLIDVVTRDNVVLPSL